MSKGVNRTATWDWPIVLSISVSVLIWLLGVLFLIAVLIGAITHFRWYSFIVIPIALLILLLFLYPIMIFIHKKPNQEKDFVMNPDPLLEDVAHYVVSNHDMIYSRISKVFLIPYGRVARIMAQLEIVGVVGPSDGKPREILVCEEDHLKELFAKQQEKQTQNEEEILRQEELERAKKEEWWRKHPFLYIIYNMMHRWGQLPPDEW